MDELFAFHWNGPPFILFSPPHLIALTCVVLACLWVLGPGRRLSPTAGRIWRYTLAGILTVNEIAYNVWFWVHGLWSIQYMLPLHLCMLFTWLSVIMLLTRSYRIFEFAYFMGIGGAIQALLTPDIGVYGFPHFRAFQSFISHGGYCAGSAEYDRTGRVPSHPAIGRTGDHWGKSLYGRSRRGELAPRQQLSFSGS